MTIKSKTNIAQAPQTMNVNLFISTYVILNGVASLCAKKLD